MPAWPRWLRGSTRPSSPLPSDDGRLDALRDGVNGRPPLFTPLFFLMCGFSFTVFVSAFQLLPTAPFHIIDLGGSTFASGLFLGFLTYASAFSAPVTGAIADRFGQRCVGVAVLSIVPPPCKVQHSPSVEQ